MLDAREQIHPFFEASYIGAGYFCDFHCSASSEKKRNLDHFHLADTRKREIETVEL
jgi:hypothetical protein